MDRQKLVIEIGNLLVLNLELSSLLDQKIQEIEALKEEIEALKSGDKDAQEA